jgi:hypothetical protein
VKIAGAVIRDHGVIAALEATAHLKPCNRRIALLMAADLVELDMLGLKAHFQHLKGVSLEALRAQAGHPQARRPRNGKKGSSWLHAASRRKVHPAQVSVGH